MAINDDILIDYVNKRIYGESAFYPASRNPDNVIGN